LNIPFEVLPEFVKTLKGVGVFFTLVVPVISFAFKVIISDDPLTFDDVNKGIFKAIGLVLFGWNLPYLDLLNGTIGHVLFDMVNKPCPHIGYIIPYIGKVSRSPKGGDTGNAIGTGINYSKTPYFPL
jgi:hypothetical protein